MNSVQIQINSTQAHRKHCLDFDSLVAEISVEYNISEARATKLLQDKKRRQELNLPDLDNIILKKRLERVRF